MGATVDELERLGYAGAGATDPADGRAKLVRPTAACGSPSQAEARAIIADLREAWAAAMEPGELDQLEAPAAPAAVRASGA